uniref:Secreted protein n=1 Tax=Ditylenchus dipsaci TaxID=166011 RepID=A0A915DRP9_9BILA
MLVRSVLLVLILFSTVVYASLIFDHPDAKKPVKLVIKDREKYPITQTVWTKLYIKGDKSKMQHPVHKRSSIITTEHLLPQFHSFKATHWESKAAITGEGPHQRSWAEIQNNNIAPSIIERCAPSRFPNLRDLPDESGPGGDKSLSAGRSF